MSDLPRNDNPPAPSDDAPTQSVVVRFRVPGQRGRYRTQEHLQPGEQVVVETERGTKLGKVLQAPAADPAPPGQSVLRRADAQDARNDARNHSREAEAFAFCQERIKALGLNMKLVSVELIHSGSQAIFYFTSAERVDFRALVKDLARRFHTRIEMRQIGVRDAAQHTGGLGVCGRQTCCSTFLPEFKPISMRMAKDQNLALNHEKLAGACGRLRCCLQYEQSLYEEKRKTLPKVGKSVVTPEGLGRVKDVNVLQQKLRVQLQDGGYREFYGHEVQRPPADVILESGATNEAEARQALYGNADAETRSAPANGESNPTTATDAEPPAGGTAAKQTRRARKHRGNKPKPQS